MSTAKENGKSAKRSAGEPRNLERFVRKVLGARDTPDLIRILAGEGELLSQCKTLAGVVPENEPDLWRAFSAVCRKHGTDPAKIRERLAPAARSLGLWTGTEKQLDYYALLDVDAAADLDAIQKAYYQKAKTLHPDAQPAAGIDDDAFIRVNEAYTVLKDSVLRQHYDESRRSMDAWCEYPECHFDDTKRTERHRIVIQIGAVVAVLVVVTLVFSVFYESRSMRDGFQEAVPRRSDTAGAIAGAAVSGEKPAPVAEQTGDGEPLGKPPGQIRENTRVPVLETGATGASAVEEKTHEATPAEAAIRAFYTRHKDLNPRDVKAVDSEPPAETQIGPASNTTAPATAPVDSVGEEAPATFSPAKTAEAVAGDAVLARMMDETEARSIPEPSRKMRDTRLLEKASIPDAGKTQPPAEAPSGRSAQIPEKASEAPRLSDTDALAMVDRLADSTEMIERIRTFIQSYCATYEKKDLAAFSRYFAKDAVENGKAFADWAPDYRKTFRSIETLEYDITLRRFSHLIDKDLYRAEGIYRIAWQVPGGTRRAGTGDITFDLVKEDGNLRVKRLEYSEIRSSER